jgi:SAM-dependent methyltransferase
VIYTDFFDDKFHEKFRGYFDIVISRGFVEHFTDVRDVIEKHLNVLAEDGCLIVSIPNFNLRSLYGACASLFNRDLLETHNLDIMTKDAFAELFDRKDLCDLFCDYYGTLHLGLLSVGNVPFVRFGIRVFIKLQILLNPVLRLILRDKGCENRIFSPFLLYIGLKAARYVDASKRA